LFTVALAEQGANVTAIEDDKKLLDDAKIRCKSYGLNANFFLANAAELDCVLSNEVFDMVIYMASLEHMTLAERITSMRSTYKMLLSGGLFCIIGTPNRLHFLDSHTSHIPFFHWLPDELAIEYLKNTSRKEYKKAISEIENLEEKMLQFYRWGRGVSFHEIELAIMPLAELNMISCRSVFMMKKNFLYYIMKRFSSNARYESLLKAIYPNLHKAFFQPYLDIIFLKD
jgi:hypothetical protein